MTFLNPTYLWALLGILVPIVIHLWNRKKVQTIKVGSIKMLTDSEPKRTSSIRPNEWWLLLLRILMIVALVFILAEPIFKSKGNNEPLTYIIEPELLQLSGIKQLLDSVPTNAQRVMEKGFPKVEDYILPSAKSPVPQYWQMTHEMDNLATDSIIVFTRGLVSGIRGMRPTTNQRINWIVMDTGEDTTGLVETSLDKDSIKLLSIAGNRKTLSYNTTSISKKNNDFKVNDRGDSIQFNGDWISLKADRPLKVLMVVDDNLAKEVKYVELTYKAVGKFLDKPIEITSVNKIGDLDLEAYATLVWFSKAELENHPINTLIYRPDSLTNQLVVQGDTKNTYFLTQPLNSENVVTEHLPEQLMGLLSLHEDLSEKASNYDLRILDSKEIQTLAFNVKKDKNYFKTNDITNWIWPLLVLFIIIERIFANYRRQ